MGTPRSALATTADLHVTIDRVVLEEFREALRAVHGSGWRGRMVAKETENALQEWTKVLLRQAVPTALDCRVHPEG